MPSLRCQPSSLAPTNSHRPGMFFHQSLRPYFVGARLCPCWVLPPAHYHAARPGLRRQFAPRAATRKPPGSSLHPRHPCLCPPESLRPGLSLAFPATDPTRWSWAPPGPPPRSLATPGLTWLQKGRSAILLQDRHTRPLRSSCHVRCEGKAPAQRAVPPRARPASSRPPRGRPPALPLLALPISWKHPGLLSTGPAPQEGPRPLGLSQLRRDPERSRGRQWCGGALLAEPSDCPCPASCTPSTAPSWPRAWLRPTDHREHAGCLAATSALRPVPVPLAPSSLPAPRLGSLVSLSGVSS